MTFVVRKQSRNQGKEEGMMVKWRGWHIGNKRRKSGGENVKRERVK